LSSLYLSGFALIHTAMASQRFKRRMHHWLGSAFGYYRLVYNLLQIALLGGFALLFLPYDRPFYRLPSVLHLPAYFLIGLSVALVLWVLLFTFDFRDFAGLRLRSNAMPSSGSLKQNGPFRICRHPVYFGTFLSFSLIPNMSLLGFVFSIFLLLYGYFGSIPEERKLLAHFGRPYREYQKRTKRLIPFLL
jgi:protein-S-isoprenylcysteine O-methyltransferase Ste14